MYLVQDGLFLSPFGAVPVGASPFFLPVLSLPFPFDPFPPFEPAPFEPLEHANEALCRLRELLHRDLWEVLRERGLNREERGANGVFWLRLLCGAPFAFLVLPLVVPAFAGS